ncbi:MAG: hypothetical protein ACFE68_09425 [Candidatus Hodarchaeota archaeon]
MRKTTITIHEDKGEIVDSKLLSGVGSGSLKIRFSMKEYVDLKKVLEETLRKIGETVLEKRPKLIGHIKATITSKKGTMKASLVNLRLGVDFSGTLPENVREGEIFFLAVVHGLKDEEVKKIVEEVTEEVLKANKIDFESQFQEHKNHNHHH